MDEILIEAIEKCSPLPGWFEAAGLSKKLSALLSVIITIALLGLLYVLVKSQMKKWNYLKEAKDLSPQFEEGAKKKYTRFYIPTQAQKTSPTREDEPGFTHKHNIDRKPLIPFFIKKAFKVSEGEKFYIILADSGMGKTTFMVNLFLRYHSFFNRHRKYKMQLYRFSHQHTMEVVKSIKYEEARKTILLLDALDEDPGIVSKDPNVTDAQAFEKRVNEIFQSTQDFCEVLMTCRTQYFPGQEVDPFELKVKRSDDMGFYTLNKLYISPFTFGEVNRYLKMKYGFLPFINKKKKQDAAKLVNQSHYLVMRPMMLSYIDDLLSEPGKKYETDYDIYETLIEKWLIREARKRKGSVDQPAFIKSLRQASQESAIAIWKLWQTEKRLYLTKEEIVAIAALNQIDLTREQMTGQALLTNDGAGNWKFAHKSIMEFFLARHIAENFGVFKTFNFTGMDMARKFCQDLGLMNLILLKGGTFLMGSPADEKGRRDDETQHEVKVNDFYMSANAVTVRQFETFVQAASYQTDADKDGGSYFWDGKKAVKKAGTNWRCDVKGGIQENKNHPVLHVSWNDANAYCQWLSKQYGGTFRLPAEAEWEYACRTGTQSPFNTGDNLTTAQANYDGNFPYENNPKGKYLKSTTPVGSYPPNAWGLYDMHGNVWEWCHDWYDKEYYNECKAKGTVENPAGPTKGALRVIRGGSWGNGALSCRSAHRFRSSPANRDRYMGFRPVFVPQ